MSPPPIYLLCKTAARHSPLTPPRPLDSYILLPDQEDQIQDQIAAVKKTIRIERDDHDDIRQSKLKELAGAKDKLAALHAATSAARQPAESRPAGRGDDVEMERRERSREVSMHLEFEPSLC